MRLDDKLRDVQANNLMFEMGTLLDGARVSVNWYGQRVVTVEGYEGSVKIDCLAKRYLEAEIFQSGLSTRERWQSDAHFSLQERLTCYVLWGRVKELYSNSDNAVQNTYLYRYLVFMKELIPFFSSNQRVIIEKRSKTIVSVKKVLFEFSPRAFQNMLPHIEPVDKLTITSIDGRGEPFQVWIANKEMVEAALAHQCA